MTFLDADLANRLPPLIGGRAALDRLGAELVVVIGAEIDAAPVVVVADEIVEANGYLAALQAGVGGRAGVAVHVLPAGEPTAESVEAAAQAVRLADPSLVIGVGGGTALDTAKLAAAVAAGTAGVEHYVLGADQLPVGPPVVAVPTTSGTGSEVTRTCVLTARSGRKVWVWGDELLPRLVVLDPDATATMPAHVTASTGLDAFVHAVEAATGRRADDSVVGPAVRAIALIREHLPRATADGDDLESRQAMQVAATLAGAAIDGGGTGIAHSIGHALGTLAGVPHGVAVAVGLAAALEWNVAGAPGAFDAVAAAIGRPLSDVADVYAELLAACSFADCVRRIGPVPVTVADLAATMFADENRPMYDNNCRRADDGQRHELAEATLRTWDDLVGGAPASAVEGA